MAYLCNDPAGKRRRLLLRFLVSMAIMAVITLLVAVWVVRRVTAPLTALSKAASQAWRGLEMRRRCRRSERSRPGRPRMPSTPFRGVCAA